MDDLWDNLTVMWRPTIMISVAVLGLSVIGLALIMTSTGKSVFGMAANAMGMCAGPIASLFILGMCFPWIKPLVITGGRRMEILITLLYRWKFWCCHYNDVMMANQRKHQWPASLAFVWGIPWGPVNSPHKWPVTRKMFPFDDVIMCWNMSLHIIENIQ